MKRRINILLYPRFNLSISTNPSTLRKSGFLEEGLVFNTSDAPISLLQISVSFSGTPKNGYNILRDIISDKLIVIHFCRIIRL